MSALDRFVEGGRAKAARGLAMGRDWQHILSVAAGSDNARMAVALPAKS